MAGLPIHGLSKDGKMRCDHNGGDGTMEPNYYPNSISTAPKHDPSYDWTPVHIEGTLERKYASKYGDNPDYEYLQVRELYKNVMTDQHRKNLHTNMADALKHVQPHIQKNMLVRLFLIDPAYAKGVAQPLEGIDLKEIERRAKSFQTR